MYSWGVAKRRAAICMRRVYSKGKGGGRKRKKEEGCMALLMWRVHVNYCSVCVCDRGSVCVPDVCVCLMGVCVCCVCECLLCVCVCARCSSICHRLQTEVSISSSSSSHVKKCTSETAHRARARESERQRERESGGSERAGTCAAGPLLHMLASHVAMSRAFTM